MSHRGMTMTDLVLGMMVAWIAVVIFIVTGG